MFQERIVRMARVFGSLPRALRNAQEGIAFVFSGNDGDTLFFEWTECFDTLSIDGPSRVLLFGGTPPDAEIQLCPGVTVVPTSKLTTMLSGVEEAGEYWTFDDPDTEILPLPFWLAQLVERARTKVAA